MGKLATTSPVESWETSRSEWQKDLPISETNQDLRKLDMLHAAQDVRTLATPPGNRLERLRGERKAQYSIRINDQWWGLF